MNLTETSNKLFVNSELSKHTMSQSAVNPAKLRFKRFFDILVSLFVFVFILSWLIPVLAILLKLDSSGPVFFIQRRVGAGGKLFRCIKLRSMVENENADFLQASDNDPRITRFGKFLRKSCLDELPQFVNVLLGDMSIVGPRPHMIADCRNFEKVIPDYNRRHCVKPGITGMAQVKGYKGQTASFHDVFHRYQWDIFYVRNAGFMLDVKIIHQTVLQILKVGVKPRASVKKAASPRQRVSRRFTFLKNFRNQPMEV